MLTLANGLSNMLIYVEFDPIFLHILTIHHISVAGKWRNFNNLSDHLHLQDLQPVTQQHNPVQAFKRPTLSMMSEESGH